MEHEKIKKLDYVKKIWLHLKIWQPRKKRPDALMEHEKTKKLDYVKKIKELLFLIIT